VEEFNKEFKEEEARCIERTGETLAGRKSFQRRYGETLIIGGTNGSKGTYGDVFGWFRVCFERSGCENSGEKGF
jgi:hypothetical protein